MKCHPVAANNNATRSIFLFIFSAMNRYSCYYCEFSTDDFKSIIDHLCDQHGELWLKCRELELDCTTGALGHRTWLYENIRPVEHDISVTSDDRVLIQNADRSKRKKMNTPKF